MDIAWGAHWRSVNCLTKRKHKLQETNILIFSIFESLSFSFSLRYEEIKETVCSYSWTREGHGQSLSDRLPRCGEVWPERSGSRSAPCCTGTSVSLISTKEESVNRYMNDRNIWVDRIIFLFSRFWKYNHKRGLTNPQPDRRRRTRWCHRRATSSPCEEGRTPVSSCLPCVNPAAWWSGPWARGSSPFCGGGGWGSTLRFVCNIPERQMDWVIQWKCAVTHVWGVSATHQVPAHLRSDPTPVVGVRSLRV